jgi:hypothetical protein
MNAPRRRLPNMRVRIDRTLDRNTPRCGNIATAGVGKGQHADMAIERLTFVVTLRAEPGADAISLRALLKLALRRWPALHRCPRRPQRYWRRRETAARRAATAQPRR